MSTKGRLLKDHAAGVRTAPGRRPEATPQQQGIWSRLGPSGVVLAAAIAVTIRDPHASGSWGICPTYAIFGVYCPGCGSLRGLHDLAQGDWAEAVGHNALILPGILFIAFSAVRTPGRLSSYAWLAAFLAFTIARNFPGSPLAP